MTYVVTSDCQGCRFTDCVEACPVDCFHADEEMLYIDPVRCIDCGACVPSCPAEAIYPEGALPPGEDPWLAINAERSARLPVLRERRDPLPGAYARAFRRGHGMRV